MAKIKYQKCYILNTKAKEMNNKWVRQVQLKKKQAKKQIVKQAKETS